MKKILLMLLCILLLSGCGDSVDSQKKYKVEIDVKDYGVIKAELDASVAPITVENFIKLTESGFYEGLTFHRIMKDFMEQPIQQAVSGTFLPKAYR